MASPPGEHTFPATLAAVPEIIATVMAAAQHCALSPEVLGHVELAVEEAAVNVASYAYGGGPGTIVLRLDHRPSELQVELEDRGVPFDPLAAPPPDLAVPLEQRRVGGLGIFLIRKVAKTVTYRREGDRNVLTIVFDGCGR